MIVKNQDRAAYIDKLSEKGSIGRGRKGVYKKQIVDFVNALDEEVPSYKVARDLYGDSASADDAFAEGMKGWHAEFENFKFKDRQYYPGVSDGDYIPDGGVRVYGTWHYNHKATGKVFETKYYGVFQFNEEGKIAYDFEWFDLGGIFAQLEE